MSRQLLKPALLGLAACGLLLVADSAQAGHRHRHCSNYSYSSYSSPCGTSAPCGQTNAPCGQTNAPCGQASAPCGCNGTAAMEQPIDQNVQGNMNNGQGVYTSSRPVYQNGQTYQGNQPVPMNQPQYAPAPLPPNNIQNQNNVQPAPAPIPNQNQVAPVPNNR